MDKKLKKHAALYMLIRLVDENKGSIEINTDKVKRVFNDENEYVTIEYTNGDIGLAADADFETLDAAVLKWMDDNMDKCGEIMLKMMREYSEKKS